MSLRITFGLFVIQIIFVCSKCDYYDGDYVYMIPEPTVEAFEPKGLRVSIPHANGIGLFAFHANINKELKDIDAGELSKDIVKKTGDKWVYENKNIKLKLGDTINYWLFVIKNNLGYKLDRQSFVVDRLDQAPEGFSSKPGPNKRPHQTTPKSTTPRSTTYRTQPTKPSYAHCPACPACATLPPATTPLPTMTTSNSVHQIVNVWTESLNNATEEKVALIQQVRELEALTEQLLKKLEMLGYGNDKRLVMSGTLPSSINPETFVETVLREKLLVRDKVFNAQWDKDNTIVFEMETFDGKLNVLKIAKEKLEKSKIKINDYA